MQLSTKIAYNTIIQIVNKILVTLLALVVFGIITRELGIEGFGTYTTIITFLSFFGIMADLGLTLVSSQMLSQSKQDDEKEILGNLLTFRLVTAILFLGVAPLAVFLFPYTQEIKYGVAITTLAFLFIALNQVLVGFFQKQLRMDKVAISEIISKIVLIVGVVISIKLNQGINGILFATVSSSAVSFLINYIFAKSLLPFKLKFDFEIWKRIMVLSWPLAITTTLNLIYLKSDTLLLSITPRESEIGIIAEVGIYGAAYKVIDVLITFPFMFAGIILPVLSAKWSSLDFNGFKKIIQKAFDIMMILAVPIIIGTQFIATEIITCVAGNDFALSGPILQVLILACGLIFFGIIPTHAIVAISKQKQLISFYLFTAITSLVGYLILIPIISYFGAAWMTVYSEAIVALAAFYLLWKYVKFIPNFKITFKALLASVIMASFIFLMIQHTRNMSIVLPISIITYFISLYLFNGINKNDILILLNKSK